jgi:ubiquinone/menaquinone biosynthesis C-methylase UbiE
VATSHNETVRREFERQATTFTASGWAASGLDWIAAQVRPSADEHVLEVAAGAGHVGRTLAARVAHVTAVDLTRAVLEHGKAEADAAGQRNIVFEVGDAQRLPYLDETFDVVVSRLSVHHFEDPAAPIAEMARVCRRAGRIVLIDMITSPELREPRDRLETLRDPSHTRTHSIAELCSLLERAGAAVVSHETRDNPLQLNDWLERTQTPDAAREQIEAALRAELKGGPATGMRPYVADGELWFTHVWAAVTATAVPADGADRSCR